MLIEKMELVLEQIEKQRRIIAKARDELKEIQDQLETELKTFDQYKDKDKGSTRGQTRGQVCS